VSDLTEQEQTNVRAALEYLRVRCGGLDQAAKALRAKFSYLRRVKMGLDPVSASLALRVARLGGASVDDVLAGRWPAPGTCPHCGQLTPAAAQ
jgi:hypothetical protein